MSVQSMKINYKPIIWFLTGFGAFIFTRVGNYIPFALPFAAFFILKFARSQPAARSILLMAVGFPAAGMLSQLSLHGGAFQIIYNIIQLTLKGFCFMLPYAVDRLLYRRFRGLPSSLVFPVSAIALYFLNSSFGIFKGTAHYYAFMQYGNLPMMQTLAIAGIWGAGFMLLWAASFACWLLENKFDRGRTGKGVIVFASIALTLLLYGGIRTSPRFYRYSGKTVNIASVLYADYSPGDILEGFRSRTFTDPSGVLSVLEPRIRQAAEAGADIVALQEYGILIPEQQEEFLVDGLRRIAAENGIYLCANYVYLPPMMQESYEYTFGFIELPDEEEGRNKALLINDRGEVVIEYIKRHLPKLEGNYILNSDTDDFPVADTPFGRIGLVICMDMEFSDYMRQAADKKADIIIAPSSEAASALAITYSQMLRAVEYGFSFIRPCNFGLSVAVDYHGNILASMNSFTTPLDTMYAHVPTEGVGTLYGRIGDLFAWLCCAALLYFISAAAASALKSRRR